MNKEDNPFYTLAQQIKPNINIQQINIGKVISVSPLLISCNGIQLDREDVLINKELLKGTKRKVKIDAIDVTGNLQTEHGGTLDSFTMDNGEIKNLENTFKIGSTVVLLTNDNQKFYLICEV